MNTIITLSDFKEKLSYDVRERIPYYISCDYIGINILPFENNQSTQCENTHIESADNTRTVLPGDDAA